jgi:predicted phage tail protein
VQCSIDGAWTDAIFFPNPTDPKAGTWEFTPAPLADGLHVIQVRAIDEDGEETPAEIYAEGGAGCITFTLDTRAPVITNVAASDVTPGSVVITWTTDEPASSQADYGTDTDYGSVSELDADLTTEHAVTLAGLKPQRQYHFRVRSTDDVGNEAVSEDYSLSKPFAAWIYAATAIGGLVVLGIGVSAAAAVRRLLR